MKYLRSLQKGDVNPYNPSFFSRYLSLCSGKGNTWELADYVPPFHDSTPIIRQEKNSCLLSKATRK